MDVAQTFGSSSSYARKYALNGLFLIDDTKDVDHEERLPNATKEQLNHALSIKMPLEQILKKYSLTQEEKTKYKQLINK